MVAKALSPTKMVDENAEGGLGEGEANSREKERKKGGGEGKMGHVGVPCWGLPKLSSFF